MSNRDAIATNPKVLAATIDNIKHYAAPNPLTGKVRFDELIEVGKQDFVQSWRNNLKSIGVTAANAEFILGAEACAVAHKYGFIQNPRTDHNNVEHSEACLILWMLTDESERKPGARRAAARNEYGWLRSRLLGIVAQINKSYGVILKTTDGSEELYEAIKAGLPEAASYNALRGTRFTVDGWVFRMDTEEGKVCRQAMARAKAALARVEGIVAEMLPKGNVCVCGRVHGVVEQPSTVEEAPAEEADMTPPVEEVVSDAQALLMADAANLATDAQLAVKAQGIKATDAKVRAFLGYPKVKTAYDAAMQVILNKDAETIKKVYDILAQA